MFQSTKILFLAAATAPAEPKQFLLDSSASCRVGHFNMKPKRLIAQLLKDLYV
jgi:hypothetical protein